MKHATEEGDTGAGSQASLSLHDGSAKTSSIFVWVEGVKGGEEVGRRGDAVKRAFYR